MSRREARRRRLPLLPALIFTIAVTQLPFLGTIVVSFMDWRALRPDQRGFTGFDNYEQVFTNPSLRSSIMTTIVLTATVVLVSLLLGLGIALLLDRKFFGRGLARTLMIAPFLVVPVAAALLWKHGILNPSFGLVNGVLSWVWSVVGSDSPPQVAWLQDFPLLSIELALVWQWTPFMMLILLAGLQSKPADVVEAARVDGASGFQIFRYITFPHLRRYLELGALLGTIYIVQAFDAVFIMTAGALGTANLPYTIYATFFQQQNYGLASAQGVVVVLGTIVVATLALRVVSSLFDEENAR
jgi:sorbitol/mannitol transport system permease protein